MATYRCKEIDTITGEILRDTLTTSKKESVTLFDMYIKENAHLLYRLREGLSIKVYIKLVTLAERGTNIVKLTTQVKREAANDIRCSEGSFSNSLTDLKKEDLIKMVRGNLMLNPNVSWFGRTNERSKGIDTWRKFN